MRPFALLVLLVLGAVTTASLSGCGSCEEGPHTAGTKTLAKRRIGEQLRPWISTHPMRFGAEAGSRPPQQDATAAPP